MSYETFVGLRYLKAKRKQSFISLITWISIGGVAVGVMALIVVLSVMDGMHDDLREKILGTNSHVVVLSGLGSIKEHWRLEEKVRSLPRVVSTAPFIFNHGMLNSGRGVAGVAVRGIDPHSESTVTDLSSRLLEGKIEYLSPNPSRDEDGIIIGADLAGILGVFLGDTLDMVSPYGRVTPMGNVPRIKTFQVVGIFKTGMYEYDSSLALVSIPVAQRFFSMGETVTGIEVKVDDIYKAREVRDAIYLQLGAPYRARDWIDMNRNLFSALKLEKFAMFIILVLIILVAAFNIISTLIMVVMEKGRDIAILKAMGAQRSGIMKIFMLEGIIIGFAGTALGCLGGYILCEILDTYQIIKLPSDVYQLDTLPVKMTYSVFATVSGAALLISFLATLYPAWSAARLDPVEALRYE